MERESENPHDAMRNKIARLTAARVDVVPFDLPPMASDRPAPAPYDADEDENDD